MPYTPSSVTSFSVTKFRPGLQMITLPSAIRTSVPLHAIRRGRGTARPCRHSGPGGADPHLRPQSGVGLVAVPDPLSQFVVRRGGIHERDDAAAKAPAGHARAKDTVETRGDHRQSIQLGAAHLVVVA